MAREALKKYKLIPSFLRIETSLNDKDQYLVDSKIRNSFFLQPKIFNQNKDFAFINLVNFCKRACNLGKEVHICGLDSDYRMEPFGDIIKLIPYCDNVEKTKAICMGCRDGTLASFTKRIGNSENLVEIGSTEMYLPVCRACYNN